MREVAEPQDRPPQMLEPAVDRFRRPVRRSRSSEERQHIISATLQSTRLSARAAAIGMIAGFVVVGVFESLSEFAGLELPDLLNPTILGFVACIGGALLGNIGTQPQ